jgi:phosphatidylglycerol:prolipoprotein diacylglycerol transferase
MYGMLLSISILVCTLLAERIAKKENKNLNILWGGTFWAVLAGFLGARLYHVLDLNDYYFQNVREIFKVWQGGLGIYGGILGGLSGLIIYLKSKKQPILEWLDITALILPLGQAIGRLGNYFNKEIYPVALYESFFTTLLFGFLYRHYKKIGKKTGFYFYSYLIGYGTIRFFLEFLRTDTWTIYGLNVAQIISILLITVAVLQKIQKPTTERLLMVLTIIGIGIALYLTYVKFTSSPILCGIGDCDVVQNSKYAQFLGIHLGVWGLVYYLALFTTFHNKWKKFTQLWLIWGILFSTYLTYLEIFVIKAVCDWCLASFANIILINFIWFTRGKK